MTSEFIERYIIAGIIEMLLGMFGIVLISGKTWVLALNSSLFLDICIFALWVSVSLLLSGFILFMIGIVNHWRYLNKKMYR